MWPCHCGNVNVLFLSSDNNDHFQLQIPLIEHNEMSNFCMRFQLDTVNQFFPFHNLEKKKKRAEYQSN